MEKTSPQLPKPLSSSPTYEESPEDKIVELLEKIKLLEKENIEMTIVLNEAGLSISNNISETEYICIKQLRLIKEISEKRSLNKEEILAIDILHKNLLMARNVPISKKSKEKKKSVAELLKIVEG